MSCGWPPESTSAFSKRSSAVSEAGARRLVERMAVTLQASLLLRHAPRAVADGFVAARLPRPRAAYGTLPVGVDAGAIVLRALPA